MHVTYSRWRPIAALVSPFGPVTAWRPYAPRPFVHQRLPGGLPGTRLAAAAFSGALAVSALSLAVAPTAPSAPAAPIGAHATTDSGPASFDLPGGPGPAAFAPARPQVLQQALRVAASRAASPPPAWWTAPVAAAARATGLPAALIAAVVHVESQGETRAVSPAGAMGLMQLEPRTAASLGVRNAFDPMANAIGGARYLSLWLRQYGKAACVPTPLRCPHALALALAAYNAGPGAVRNYGGIPPFPQTRRYVRSVTTLYQRYASGTATSGAAAAASRSPARQPGSG